MAIYSPMGELVNHWEMNAEQGDHSFVWDARNAMGNHVEPGVYILQLTTSEQKSSIQLVVH